MGKKMGKEFRVVNINEVEEILPNPKLRIRRLVSRKNVGSDKLTLGIGYSEPGGPAFEWSYAENDEAYYMLKGKIMIYYNDKKVELREGQAAFFPAGIKYRIVNSGTEKAIVIYALAPPPLDH